MTNEQQLTRLQDAYREMAHAYAPHLTTAATLTLKQHARIRVRRFDNVADEHFEFCQKLNDEIIDSTICRFTYRLTRYLFGNHASHANKKHWAKPLILVAIEGRKWGKLPHLHVAVGNVPLNKQDRIGGFIEMAWHDCDFGNQQIRVEPLTNACGWLDYMTKDVEFRDADVVAIQHASISEIIQRSI